MRFFDHKFKDNIPRYILQCFLAMVLIFITLFLIDTISSMTIIASLGASAFIALTMPHTNSARPRYLIGGYVAGCLCGIAMNCVNGLLISSNIEIFGHPPHIMSCAVAVGLAMFLMAVTSLEHPPAAALAMGLVREENVLVIALVAVLCIVIITLINTAAKKWLRDLL